VLIFLTLTRTFGFPAFLVSLQEPTKFCDESPELYRVFFFGNPSAKFPQILSIFRHSCSPKQEHAYITNVRPSLLAKLLSLWADRRQTLNQLKRGITLRELPKSLDWRTGWYRKVPFHLAFEIIQVRF
jgi:hypothetical protein